ncbi:protein YciZ/DeoL [Dryocola sp. BD613]|uniref:protein YciZ/DeoL n=1 Tax=Dryocola sp. BD613 TaxID=3133272 RepID=UPI003F5045F3
MATSVDPRQLAKRIDTVLDILVAGDHASALNNLEILKAELLSIANGEETSDSDLKKSPWEI